MVIGTGLSAAVADNVKQRSRKKEGDFINRSWRGQTGTDTASSRDERREISPATNKNRRSGSERSLISSVQRRRSTHGTCRACQYFTQTFSRRRPWLCRRKSLCCDRCRNWNYQRKLIRQRHNGSSESYLGGERGAIRQQVANLAARTCIVTVIHVRSILAHRTVRPALKEKQQHINGE